MEILPNNKFRVVAKDDPADRLHVEVGDTKQADFFPQCKLMRWDNEVNLSVRLIDDSPGKPSISQTGGGNIRWEKPQIEAHFYEHPVSEEHSEGGFEFEVILKEKPLKNILQFSIQTKGLDFFYQPALTQQEIDDGCSRPENVVGSYAVYHATQRGDLSPAGGKNYRAGKAFHIYRPKFVDSIGNWAWGVLTLDKGIEILSIEIPQYLLDTAVYPVNIDPTFGYTTAGASSAYKDPNEVEGSLFTSPADTTVASSLTVSGRYDVSANIKGMLVLHSNLNIVTNGIGGAVALGATQAWKTSTFSISPTVTPSTGYVLGVVVSAGALIYYDTGSTDQGHADGTNSYNSPTNPTDAVHTTRKTSIYCTYTALTNISATDQGSGADLFSQAVSLNMTDLGAGLDVSFGVVIISNDSAVETEIAIDREFSLLDSIIAGDISVSRELLMTDSSLVTKDTISPVSREETAVGEEGIPQFSFLLTDSAAIGEIAELVVTLSGLDASAAVSEISLLQSSFIQEDFSAREPIAKVLLQFDSSAGVTEISSLEAAVPAIDAGTVNDLRVIMEGEHIKVVG